MKQADNLKMEDNLHELRKFVLKDLMKMGYKYIARDREGKIYAYADKPTKQKKEEEWISARNREWFRKNFVKKVYKIIST